jgi:hypothetical protein
MVGWLIVVRNGSSTEGGEFGDRHRFNSKEMTQLIGGIGDVALLQAGLLFPETHDFVGSWLT